MAHIYCAEDGGDAVPAAAAQALYTVIPIREEDAL